MPHSPQLEFKFNPLNIPNGVTILWTHVFHMRPNSNGKTPFLFIYEKLIFRKRLGVATYFCFIFFYRENKIRKKTLCNSLFGKDMSVKTESRFGGQVTYWEGTVVSRSTPLSLYTYDLY